MPGNVEITSYPNNAEIYIDDVLITYGDGQPVLTPAVLTLADGLHEIRLVLHGYCDQFTSVEIPPDTMYTQYRHRNLNIC